MPKKIIVVDCLMEILSGFKILPSCTNEMSCYNCEEFLYKRYLYSTPCPSSMLNIFKVKSLSGPKVWPVNKIDCKYFSYQTNNNSP